MTAKAYEADLEGNLRSLLDRAKSGSYRAPAVRRVHIPKGGSTTETRPIGISTLEDKLLQRAVLMLLEPIYEVDFHEFSYGFRPGRSAHMAIDATLIPLPTEFQHPFDRLMATAFRPEAIRVIVKLRLEDRFHKTPEHNLRY